MPGADLTLTRVSAGYGQRAVLRDVSIRVAAGEVVGLIGPNGSGKTTSIRVASRGLRPSAGAVRIGGFDPYAIPARKAARLVAVVPQDVVPAFAYTVLEVVLMGRSPYLSPWGGGSRDDWHIAREAMAMTDIQHLADRTLEHLSGGERQRVVLAQAMAQQAPLLLLDEPTTHLDLRHLLDVLVLVRRMARSNETAVLAVFHDLNLAAAHCDRIYAMSEGQVVVDGEPREVITPELLVGVFGVKAEVFPSPTTGLPLVVPGSAGSRVGI